MRRGGWLAGFGATALLAALFALAGPAEAAGPLSWGSPVSVDHQRPHEILASLTAVSCPSATLCVGVDDLGDVITSAHPAGPGSSWKFATTKAGSLTGVSCPSARLCVAVGSGGAVLVSKHPRTGPWPIARVAAGNFGGVSCASASLCVAFQGAQLFVSRNPEAGRKSWHLAYTDPSAVPLRAVSCPSRSFCAAVDDAGDVISSTHPAGGSAAWRLAHVDRFTGDPLTCGYGGFGGCAQASLLAISCPSRSFCLAADSAGHVFTSKHPTAGSLAWRSAHIDSPSGPNGASTGKCVKLSGCAGFVTSVSCPSARLCFAADPWGVVFVSRRPNGGAPAWRAVQPAYSYKLVGISCPSAALCVAVKSEAALVSKRPTGRPSAWRIKYVHTRGVTSLSAISCPSISLCVTGDDRGHLFASTNPIGGASAWTLQYTQPPPPESCEFGNCPAVISALSCGSVSFCVALTGETGYYRPAQTVITSHRPVGGTRAWKASSGPGLDGLSCPTASWCVGSSGGDILTSNPAGPASGWTVQYTEPPSIVEPCGRGGCAGDIGRVSCASATLCVAVNGDGYVLSSTDPTGGASAWSATQVVPGCGASCPGLAGVSCPSTSFCVIGSYAGIFTSTSPATGPWNLTPIPGGAPSIFPGSCPSTSLCVGARGNDLVVSTDPAGGAWTTAYVDHGLREPNLTGVACPSVSLCVAIDSSGDVILGRNSSVP